MGNLVSYSQGIAPYYDLFSGSVDPSSRIAEFLSRHVEPSASLLDIGAGTGSLAMAMAGRGFHVTALEPDPEMFAVLLTRLAGRLDLDGRVTPIPHGAGFKTGMPHDAASCLSVLHLLTPSEQEKVVAYAAAEVRRGGKIILGIPTASSARSERAWSMNSSRRLARLRIEHHSSMEKGASDQWKTHWRFVTYLDDVKAHEVSRTFEWAPLSQERTDALLAAHGLTAVADFSGYDGEPYVAGQSSLRLVVACTREA